MKAALRLGAVAALFGLLLIFASAEGGLRQTGKAEAAAGHNLTIRVTDPGSTVDHQFTVTKPNPCVPSPSVVNLSNGEFATFQCGGIAGAWSVAVSVASGRQLTGVNCTVSEIDTPTAGQQSIISGLNNNVLTLEINDDEDVDCTFTFAASVRTLELVADPAFVACGGTTTITATVRESNGAIVSGLTYNFSTTVGTLGDDPSDGVGTLTLQPGQGSATVTVTVAGLSGQILIENRCLPLTITANPAYLPCGGGTTNLTAVLRDVNGNEVPNVVYQWSVTPGATLDVGAPNTPAVIDGFATLFLPSATPSATVTVTSNSETRSIVIQQVCGPIAIAVTADPNVIPCGGTTNLTATARDVNGHIVHGVQWHWSTEVGQLYVGPPNTADAIDNRATLTLVPGMTSSVVKAWVGGLSQDPGEVTVQQFCPDVVTDGSGASGSIQLSSSNATPACGEAVFIGARVRDSKNQVVAEGTDLRFLASAGAFQLDAGTTITYSSSTGGNGNGNGQATTNYNGTLVSQYNGAVDKNGVMNLTYVAPSYPGDVQITAASGDKFAKLTLKVQCAAPVAAASGGGAASQPACTPIGDGVCIRAPGTGVRITPPSTGDAGIK